MRRLAQIAAILVIALLATHPLAEGFACSLNLGAASRCCPMDMSDLSPACSMAQQSVAAGCMQNCCRHALPQTAVLIADLANPKVELVEFVPAVAPAAPSTGVASP